MARTPIRRNPDSLTAHLAGGGSLDGDESAWVQHNLAQLRAAEPGDSKSQSRFSIADLKNIYMGARIIQGSVVASRIALPALTEAGQIVRGASLPEDFRPFTDLGSTETERYLTGSENGRPRQGNDYPQIVKTYISSLAGLLIGPYHRAYTNLKDTQPDLLALGRDADELNRLSWAHIRWRINEVLPTDEIASYRMKPLREGTDELLAVARERTGLSLPSRIMQRDGWRAALERPRQAPETAFFNSLTFFVENAEIGILYCLGSLLTRLKLGRLPQDALQDHVCYGPKEIAAGTLTVTHRARFQSRRGARPNDYRSFDQFLKHVSEQTARASLQPDGSIAWDNSDTPNERGWCPAQNRYEPRGRRELKDLAEQGSAAVEAWREYGRTRYGVTPILSTPAPSELFGAFVVFATIHEHSPLRADSNFLQKLARHH